MRKLFEWVRKLLGRSEPASVKPVSMSATVSTTARLVAEKKPAPKPMDHAVDAADGGTFSERGVRAEQGKVGRPTTAYRISDSSVSYSSGADLSEGGRIGFRIEGEPQQNEEGSLLAAQHVVERLNTEGSHWGGIELTPRDARKERGVDATAHDPDGHILQLQVTRAERGLWRQLSKTKIVSGSFSLDEAVEALWLTMDEKRTASDPNVLLVLDAANTGQFAFDVVVTRFRQLRGGDAARLGFAQVWLAGPTVETTSRLDVTA